MERSEVLDLLKNKSVDLTFMKKDGSMRYMTCTLRESVLPKQIDAEEHIQKKKPNNDVLAVYDTIEQGWRSFRWDSLKTVNGEPFE